MELKILFDNEALSGFKKGWGFSCLVEIGKKKLLFDTGNGPGFLANMEKFGIFPRDINHVILSHPHHDHIGGLSYLLQYNPGLSVHVPAFFPFKLKAALMSSCDFHETFGLKQIEENFWVDTAENILSEQFCLINTKHGLLILTGCAHPGLNHIFQKANIHQKPFFGVIGGFHNFNDLELLRNLSFIAPCHCTTSKNAILHQYPNKAHKCASGIVFKFQ